MHWQALIGDNKGGALGRSIKNYAAPVWSTNASESNIGKIQCAQNEALMIITGWHKIDHGPPTQKKTMSNNLRIFPTHQQTISNHTMSMRGIMKKDCLMTRRRPGLTVPNRHSLHEVGMLPTSAQIVSTQPLSPEMGVRFRFWASRPSFPSAWLALLLTKAGDVKSNPVPTSHTNKHSPPALTPVICICNLCHKQQTSIR